MSVETPPGAFSDSAPFDPATLPYIDVAAARMGSPNREVMQPNEADLQAFGMLHGYYQTYASEVALNVQKAVSSTPHIRQVDALKPYEMAVGIPVGVKGESQASIAGTYESVRDAIRALGRKTLVVSLLNFSADQRREHELATAMQRKASRMGYFIMESLEDVAMMEEGGAAHPATDSLVVIDRMRAQPTVSEVRHVLAQIVAGQALAPIITMKGLLEPLHNKYEHIKRLLSLEPVYNLPYVQIDADTSIGTDALQKSYDLLATNKALFVNGKMHYVGGVMDKPLEGVAQESDNQKLIYVTEMLRRAMFDNLPPNALHGYLPEAGLGIKLGPLLTLGEFDIRSRDNESYLLQLKAVQALNTWFDVSTYISLKSRGSIKADIQPGKPHISNRLAEQLEHFTYYGEYAINTSIRGVERMVADKGPYRLVGFDQNEGEPYELWSNTPGVRRDDADIVLDLREKLQLLDSIYSYFKDYGGQFSVEELKDYNAILRSLFAADMPAGTLIWSPTYIERDERPKSNTALKLP